MVNILHHATALSTLATLPDDHVDMIYTDPPFGTGDVQRSRRQRAGKVISNVEYSDKYDDYLAFLEPHLGEMKRVLKPSGTMYLHLDYRWVHYVKVMCDKVFGDDNFLNEIIWAYDFGGRGKDKFPSKHDNILVYTKDMKQHVFNWEEVDRIPYMAPGLQKDPARAVAGKVPTDVWWMSIVGTQSKERVGYPNQKPVKLVERAVRASSPVGGLILDPFAGSGTTAMAAHVTGRNFVVSDQSDVAVETMKTRFSGAGVTFTCT